MPDNSFTGGDDAAAAFPPVPTGRSAADLAQFWTDYQPIVARAAASRLRRLNIPESLASADDVTQEVYVEVAQHWSEVDHAGKYTFGCALKTVIGRFHRERLRRIGVLFDDDPKRLGETVDVGPGPEDVVLDDLVDAQLRGALPDAWHTLSEKEQAAVELTVLSGASRMDTAERMSVATGTVSSHRTRGIAKLRIALHPYSRASVAGCGAFVFAAAVEQFGIAIVLVALALASAVLIGVISALWPRLTAGAVLPPLVGIVYLCISAGLSGVLLVGMVLMQVIFFLLIVGLTAGIVRVFVD